MVGLRKNLGIPPHWLPECSFMAEEVGFEPTVDFHLRRFSRPVHSTTLPLLRVGMI